MILSTQKYSHGTCCLLTTETCLVRQNRILMPAWSVSLSYIHTGWIRHHFYFFGCITNFFFLRNNLLFLKYIFYEISRHFSVVCPTVKISKVQWKIRKKKSIVTYFIHIKIQMNQNHCFPKFSNISFIDFHNSHAQQISRFTHHVHSYITDGQI